MKVGDALIEAAKKQAEGEMAVLVNIQTLQKLS